MWTIKKFRAKWSNYGWYRCWGSIEGFRANYTTSLDQSEIVSNGFRAWFEDLNTNTKPSYLKQ